MASSGSRFLTLLLVMFVYAVIRLPPEPAGSPEPPVLTPAAPPATPRVSALPAGTAASPATPVIRLGMPLTQRPDKL